MAQVVIDNQTRFDAKVNKEKKHQVKGETYAVATGKRHIKVLYQIDDALVKVLLNS